MKLMFLTIGLAVLSLLVSCNNENTETSDATQATGAPQASATEITAADPGSGLPNLQMVAADNKMVSLSEFKGKKIFVNLWASWCPPCKREMPSIEKLYKASDTAKVAFVLLSLDDQFAKAKNYLSGAKLDLPIYYPAQNLPSLFNVQSIRTTFIFDEKGALIKKVEGSEDYSTKEFINLLK